MNNTSRRVRAAVELHWALTRHVVDSLDVGLAVVDGDGNIVLTNKAWNRLAREKGGDDAEDVDVGRKYFDIYPSSFEVDSGIARNFQLGLERVLSGISERFSFEYPCD